MVWPAVGLRPELVQSLQTLMTGFPLGCHEGLVRDYLAGCADGHFERSESELTRAGPTRATLASTPTSSKGAVGIGSAVAEREPSSISLI